MNKDEYLKKVNKITKTLSRLQRQRLDLIKEFKLACEHNKEDISISSTYEEDEFGRHMPTWERFVYKCNHCETEAVGEGKFVLEDRKIKELLIRENR